MVSVTFLKVCCQSDVGFSCCLCGYCGLWLCRRDDLKLCLGFPLSAFFKKAFCLEGGLCEGGSFVNFKENGFKDFLSLSMKSRVLTLL